MRTQQVIHAIGRWRAGRALAQARRHRLGDGWALTAVRGLLEPTGRTVPSAWHPGVIAAAVEHCVRSLDAAAVSTILHGLTDQELARWHGVLAHLPPRDRDATYVVVGERASLSAWRRFGTFTDDIDPDPSGDLRDLARVPDPLPDEVAAQLRRWERWTGPLAVRGVGDAHAYAANDVLQGHIGNCYLVAALQAIADAAPDLLDGLCRPNPNGTWTVCLPGGRRTVVSPDIVVDVHGRAIFARRPPRGEVELWPMLLEKAYAQLHGGWSQIVAGHARDAVELLTGRAGHVVRGRDLDLQYLADWHRAHATMVVGTVAAPPGHDVEAWRATAAPAPFRRPGGELDRLHPSHAFVVRDVDETAGTVTLVNPWGIEGGEVVLTEAELRACVDSLHVTELSPVVGRSRHRPVVSRPAGRPRSRGFRGRP